MTATTQQPGHEGGKDTAAAPRQRKPRVALMGEFSAGKSTLTNLLLGGAPLPVRVTATRMPPVWVSHGEATAHREDMRGNLHPVAPDDIESVSLDDTRSIRLTREADILSLCDLIDMPGISDPNMGSDMWERVIGEADHIIWCSHATQAWRQSEAAVWEAIPESLYAKSLLLLTRFDKIVSRGDRDRVLARVRRETAGLFSDVFPVSLTQAVQAGDDRARWEDSGAEAFARRLVELLMTPDAPAVRSRDGNDGKGDDRPDAEARSFSSATDAAPAADAVPASVRPKRVRSAGQMARPDTPAQPRPAPGARVL
ncbi:MAG: dynamin family protein [Rhodobacteraceae bacterium]|nr:dynamin family protein [Paracoccaceae bacterium]